MDALTWFGMAAVAAMLACYALEDRNPRYTLWMAASCVAAALYGLLVWTPPFVVLELAWALVAYVKWRKRLVSK